MKVSVIIPTYQGLSRIMNIIRALEIQTYPDFELVIVIDGSDDGTQERLHEHHFLNPVKIINQANKGRAGARNEGARVASGELLIFYDDDMLPDPDSVGRHFDFHQSAAHGSSLLTGYTPQLSSDLSSDFEQYRAFISEQWIAPFPGRLTRLERDNLFVTTQNLSVAKETFSGLQFDERLTDGEDRELGIRAFTRGISLFFDRENIARHDERLTCRQYIRRLRQYREANRKVNAMHPEFQTVSPKVTGSKLAVYKMLCSSFIVTLVDRFNLFLLLPRRLRYRFYSALTFALSEICPGKSIDN